MAICASPRLIAAYHALHRLLVPRHPLSTSKVHGYLRRIISRAKNQKPYSSVEVRGIEPLTFSVQARRSPSELHPQVYVGPSGFEPLTSPLSGVRSNHLSYRPPIKMKTGRYLSTGRVSKDHPKEVIQPHVPVRLPCYDFTLLASPILNPRRSLRTEPTRLV